MGFGTFLEFVQLYLILSSHHHASSLGKRGGQVSSKTLQGGGVAIVRWVPSAHGCSHAGPSDMSPPPSFPLGGQEELFQEKPPQIPLPQPFPLRAGRSGALGLRDGLSGAKANRPSGSEDGWQTGPQGNNA